MKDFKTGDSYGTAFLFVKIYSADEFIQISAKYLEKADLAELKAELANQMEDTE